MKSALKFIASENVLKHRKQTEEIVKFTDSKTLSYYITNNQAYTCLKLNILFDV